MIMVSATTLIQVSSLSQTREKQMLHMRNYPVAVSGYLRKYMQLGLVRPQNMVGSSDLTELF